MLNKIILIMFLGFGTLFAQEVKDIAFPIDASKVSTDSIQIPAGMIPSAIWSSTLLAPCTIEFELSVDGGSTFLTVGEIGADTTAWALALDINAGLIIPLEPIQAYIMKGTYTTEDNTTWLQMTSSATQTENTTIIWIRFIPYTGFGKD